MVSLVVVACDSPSRATEPVITSFEILRPGPLVRRIVVELEQSVPLDVRYWSDEGGRLRILSEPARRHEIDLARLRPDRRYSLEIRGTDRRDSFTTGGLPDDLAALSLRAEGDPTVPLVLLHLFNPDGFRGYVAVDRAGEVVWYYSTADLPYGATRRENGNFVLMDKGRGLLEVTPTGEVVRELPRDTLEQWQHHDVVVTPENTLLYLAFDSRTVDGDLRRGEAVWEWLPEEGKTVKRWSSWEHMDPVEDRGPRFGVEWLHANSLHVGPRGNVLVSFHYLNQVVSIAPDWESFEWRLGGVNATIAVAEEDRFTGQHTGQEIAPDRILLFDNRFEQGDASRAVEFDVSGSVAVPVWSWSSGAGNHAAAVSSARRLGSGNTLVGFGMSEGLVGSTGPVEVFEVARSGDVVWRLGIGGVWLMFRAEPLETLVGEEYAPRP